MLVQRVLVTCAATVLLLRGGQTFSIRPIARARRSCSVDPNQSSIDPGEVASTDSLYHKMFHNAFSKFLEAVMKCSEEYAEKRKLSHCKEGQDEHGEKRGYSALAVGTPASLGLAGSPPLPAKQTELPSQGKTSREVLKDSLPSPATHEDVPIKSDPPTKDKYSEVEKSYNEVAEPVGQYSERQASIQPAATNLVSSVVMKNASNPGNAAFPTMTVETDSATGLARNSSSVSEISSGPVTQDDSGNSEIVDVTQNEINPPDSNDTFAQTPKKIETDQLYDSALEGLEPITTTVDPAEENALSNDEARDNLETIQSAPSTVEENVQESPVSNASPESLPEQSEIVADVTELTIDAAPVVTEQPPDLEIIENSPSEQIESRTAADSNEGNAELTGITTDAADTMESRPPGAYEAQDDVPVAGSRQPELRPDSASLQLIDASGNSQNIDSVPLAVAKVEDSPQSTTSNPQYQTQTDSSSALSEARPQDELAAHESSLEQSEVVDPNQNASVANGSAAVRDDEVVTDDSEPGSTIVSEKSDEVVLSDERATTDENAVVASTIPGPDTVQEVTARSLPKEEPEENKPSSAGLSPSVESNEVLERASEVDRFGRESAAVPQEAHPEQTLPAESRSVYYPSDTSGSVPEKPSISSAYGGGESLQPQSSLQVFNVDDHLSKTPKIGCQCHIPKEFMELLKQGFWKSFMLEITPH